MGIHMKIITVSALLAAGVYAGPAGTRPENEDPFKLMEKMINSMNQMMDSSFKRFQAQMNENFSEQAKKFAEQQKQFETNMNERFQSWSKVGDLTMPSLDFGFKPFTSMLDSI